jgi:hypothetical protein
LAVKPQVFREIFAKFSFMAGRYRQAAGGSRESYLTLFSVTPFVKLTSDITICASRLTIKIPIFAASKNSSWHNYD